MDDQSEQNQWKRTGLVVKGEGNQKIASNNMPGKENCKAFAKYHCYKYLTKLGIINFPAGIPPSAQPTLMLNDFQQNLLVMIAITTTIRSDDGITK